MASNDDARTVAELPKIGAGTPAFRRTNLSVFSAGFATFALLYCVQPILPEFAREFRLSPAASSLALSFTTGAVAVSVLVVAGLSEAWGRKSVIVSSLFIAAVLTGMAAVTANWTTLVAFRTVVGVALAGIPAAAIAYVHEEIHEQSVALAMGLYIAGTSVGGLAGRLITAVLTDVTSWRFAIATIGALGVLAGAICWATLPPSTGFTPRPLAIRAVASAYRDHLRDLVLLALFAEGFLFMGAFVTVYNYVVFRLQEPPFSYGQGAAGSISILYLLGTASSAIIGPLAQRLGRGRIILAAIVVMMIGVVVTLPDSIVAVVGGVGVVTIGFFAAHTVCSSWVGARASHAKAQAASLYLFAFYMGSSIAGLTGGVFWAARGWYGLSAFLIALLVAALVLARSVGARAAHVSEVST